MIHFMWKGFILLWLSSCGVLPEGTEVGNGREEEPVTRQTPENTEKTTGGVAPSPAISPQEEQAESSSDPVGMQGVYLDPLIAPCHQGKIIDAAIASITDASGRAVAFGTQDPQTQTRSISFLGALIAQIKDDGSGFIEILSPAGESTPIEGQCGKFNDASNSKGVETEYWVFTKSGVRYEVFKTSEQIEVVQLSSPTQNQVWSIEVISSQP